MDAKKLASSLRNPIIYLFTNGESLISFVIVLLLGLAFLISGWVTGRKALSERRKKELNKMKTLDIS